jgi:hypothetical protein
MRRRLGTLLAATFAAGCDDLRVQLPTREPPGPAVAIGSRFDPATSGMVTGTVNWVGTRPTAPLLRVSRLSVTGSVWYDVPNPNAPRIAPDGGIGGAVVFLRGLDPTASAPWPHLPVAVQADEKAITVHPGGRVGFVPVGGEVEFRSASDDVLGVRARGAAFFTAMLPDRGTGRRSFATVGRVELTSPANVYWAVADLFVCDHPFYTRTDDRGQFRFVQVPPGNYEVVAWIPGWEMVATERDPESGAVFRARYAPPAEVRVPVRVTPRGEADTRISVSPNSFPPAGHR